MIVQQLLDALLPGIRPFRGVVLAGLAWIGVTWIYVVGLDVNPDSRAGKVQTAATELAEMAGTPVLVSAVLILGWVVGSIAKPIAEWKAKVLLTLFRIPGWIIRQQKEIANLKKEIAKVEKSTTKLNKKVQKIHNEIEETIKGNPDKDSYELEELLEAKSRERRNLDHQVERSNKELESRNERKNSIKFTKSGRNVFRALPIGIPQSVEGAAVRHFNNFCPNYRELKRQDHLLEKSNIIQQIRREITNRDYISLHAAEIYNKIDQEESELSMRKTLLPPVAFLIFVAYETWGLTVSVIVVVATVALALEILTKEQDNTTRLAELVVDSRVETSGAKGAKFLSEKISPESDDDHKKPSV